MPLYLGSTQVTLPGGGAPVAMPNYTSPQVGSQATNLTVTTGGAAHEKGAWVEIIPAVSGGANLLAVLPRVGANGVNSATLIDIATGDVGAETVLASNIAVGGIIDNYPVMVPVTVPDGGRVALRSQGLNASRSSPFNVIPYLMPASATSSDGTADVLGTDPATSLGTIMANSSGWVEIAASTPRAYKTLVLVPSVANASSNPIGQSYLRLGFGAPGSEVELGRIYPMFSNTESVWTSYAYPNPYFTSVMSGVAAGSRLVIHTSSTQSMYACVIGVPA